MIRPSILDLTLATGSIIERIHNWQVLPDLGSDHQGILFDIKGTIALFENPIQTTRFNIKLADWKGFQDTLKIKMANSPKLNSP